MEGMIQGLPNFSDPVISHPRRSVQIFRKIVGLVFAVQHVLRFAKIENNMLNDCLSFSIIISETVRDRAKITPISDSPA